MAQYPGVIPTLREVDNDDGVIYDANAKKVVFAEDINNANAEIMAIAAELGIKPKSSFANVSARIQNAYSWGVQGSNKADTAQSGVNTINGKIAGVRKILGVGRRTNTTKDNTSINDDNWRAVRNSADSANFSLTFTNTSTDVVIDVVIVMWSDQNQYKQIRVLIDGTVFDEAQPVSYLINGVAPGLARFRGTMATGPHTLTLQWQRYGGDAATVSYRSVDVEVSQIIT